MSLHFFSSTTNLRSPLFTDIRCVMICHLESFQISPNIVDRRNALLSLGRKEATHSIISLRLPLTLSLPSTLELWLSRMQMAANIFHLSLPLLSFLRPLSVFHSSPSPSSSHASSYLHIQHITEGEFSIPGLNMVKSSELWCTSLNFNNFMPS